MGDTHHRDPFAHDRLPDVRPSRSISSYTSAHIPRGRIEPDRPTRFENEPAWWETDEPAQLPDALRWRAGSIVSSHVPVAIRAALDQHRRGQQSTVGDRWGNGDVGEMLGDSRYGTDIELPVWTDADLDRERSSWQQETNEPRSGRRAKRGKRSRSERGDRRDH